jgi:hypothetical protein
LKFQETRYQPLEPTAKLLNCDFDSVNIVTIEENSPNDTNGKPKVVLHKDKHGWMLPEYYGFPASDAGLKRLFTKLKLVKKGFPITTTADAAEHFQVSPTNFQRAISLFSDHQKVTTLYLGTSPGFRNTYARVSDNNDIYSIDITQYGMSARSSDWIDKGVIQLHPDDITSVDTGSFTVQESGGNWTLASQERKHPISKEAVMQLIDRLSYVNIISVLGVKSDPDYNTQSPVLFYKLSLKNGKVITYSFSKPKDKPFYVLKISDKDYFFGVDDRFIKQLQAITPEWLLKQDAERTKQPHH